jgi:hypothetical protein
MTDAALSVVVVSVIVVALVTDVSALAGWLWRWSRDGGVR